MSNVSDKARFYLEQAIPELQELERKGIYDKNEIRSIVRKRSDYEHKINSRLCRPKDYASYLDFEINLDNLRRKRAQRLNITSKQREGQRRIFFMFDRATRKFHGDIDLWLRYIQFAKKEGANRKLEEIFTDVLRLHSNKPALWTHAASFAMESQSDMHAARRYMQRGLRFCKRAQSMWLAYARLELIYLSKIFTRRRVLGLDEQIPSKELPTSEDADSTDIVAIPAEASENTSADRVDLDDSALRQLEAGPYLRGALPVAIFDAAMDELSSDQFAADFFDLFMTFKHLPCARDIALHVISFLREKYPVSSRTQFCNVAEPIIGVSVSDPAFPSALASSLSVLRKALDQVEDREDLERRAVYWSLSVLESEDLDEGIQLVMKDTLSRLLRSWTSASRLISWQDPDLAERLGAYGIAEESTTELVAV